MESSCHLSHLSVGLCVSLCLSGKCTVAKRLIEFGCRLGWWVGRSRDGCIWWESTFPKRKGWFWGLAPLVSMVYLFNRNVFDSCVKSWQYFRMHNNWNQWFIIGFPKIQSSSRSVLGFKRNLQKCNSVSNVLASLQQNLAVIIKFLFERRQNYRQFSFFHSSENFGGLYLQLYGRGKFSFILGGWDSAMSAT